ncbi:hypothetical protein, partial [Wohlfahrtiimonas larvae]|uniref:hypothetical protein n=1 Tax=Wohlfahrtiimonas larvae TaxID=1157986 RepID=UPI003CD06269
MAREVLKGIKSENRLSKIRLIMPNDPVIGGQPSDNAEEFTSNTPFLDLACSIQYAVTQAANANTAASNADKKAGTAQTTANQAKTAAATADGKAVA